MTTSPKPRPSQIAAAVLLTAAAWAGLLALLWPVPPERPSDASITSARWTDRHGRLLAERVGPLGVRAGFVPLDEVSPHLIAALIAAEDQRFYTNPGIDPLALARAITQNVRAGAIVSGGSTLTLQLARLLLAEEALLSGQPVPPRSVWQKVKEARLALRLTLWLDKNAVLEAFLNHAPFGRGTVGVSAAAFRFFGVTPAALSLTQAAYLAALPKGPTLLNARPDAATKRQQHILGAMHRLGFITAGQLERARREPLTIAAPTPADPEHPRSGASVHAINLAKRVLDAAGVASHGTISLTVDRRLEEAVGQLLEQHIPAVYARGGKSGAVVVLDNRSGEVLALVGSAFTQNPLWGELDAATSTRQPGSALKPFIYAAALTHGLTAATIAADIERPYPDTWGVYMPENYDQRFHGPVRLRESLAQSLNVAAVDVLFRTGLDRTFTLLDALGLKTLDRRPSYFGLGLTLGSGGVRLLDLTNAYATLARGGLSRPWRIIRGDSGTELPAALAIPGPAQRLIDERVAYIIGDILADANARTPQFGPDSVLTTPYWTAVKTGTSKGFRDNWTLGFTPEVTVGVWVGDPAGRPMQGMSGVEGAGVIWRKTMGLATGGQSVRPKEPAGIVHARVCATSGELLGPRCPGGRDELFVAGSEPRTECTWHRRARVDPENDLLVPPGCNSVPDAVARDLLVYPQPFAAWAQRGEGGGVAERYTPRCPPPSGAAANATIRLLSPAPTEALRLDHDAPSGSQALLLTAAVTGFWGPITFEIDRAPYKTVDAPYQVFWPIQRGNHTIRARISKDGPVSEEHAVVVR